MKRIGKGHSYKGQYTFSQWVNNYLILKTINVIMTLLVEVYTSRGQLWLVILGTKRVNNNEQWSSLRL